MKIFRNLPNVSVDRKNVNSTQLLSSIEDYIYDILKTKDGKTFKDNLNRDALRAYLNESLNEHKENGLIDTFKSSFKYDDINDVKEFNIAVSYTQSHMLNVTKLHYTHLWIPPKPNKSMRNFQLVIS